MLTAFFPPGKKQQQKTAIFLAENVMCPVLDQFGMTG